MNKKHIVFFNAVLFIFSLYCKPAVAQQNSQNADQPSYGYLKIKTNLDSFYVVVDEDFTKFYQIANEDPLMLAAGNRNITIASKEDYDHSFTIDIKKDETAEYNVRLGKAPSEKGYLRNSSYPRLFWGANLMIYTDDDSDIFIEGKWVGRGRVKLDKLAGEYKLETKHKRAGKTKKTITTKSNRLNVAEMYNKPKKSTTRFLSIFPGFSQFYQNEKIKGFAFLSLTAATLGYSYKYHQSFEDNNTAYLNALDSYKDSRTETEALQLGDEVQIKYDASRKEADNRDNFLYAAAGVLVLNLIDVIIAPKSGYRDKTILEPGMIFTPFLGSNAVGVSVEVNF